jgi:S-DNA-T family DNA segregation ATPase FtsK/SpoIIIE
VPRIRDGRKVLKRSEVAALATGLALVLAGVFVAMSLVTWDVRDPQSMPNYQSGPAVVRNRCGAGGAVVSSLLFRAHGAAAYAVPVALAALGAWFLARRSMETGLRRAAGALVLVLALSLLAGTRTNGWLAHLTAYRSIEGPGGTFGALPVALLTRFLGGVGAYLVILFALGAGSLLVSRRAVEWALESTGRIITSAGPKLVALFGRLRRWGEEKARPEKNDDFPRNSLFDSVLSTNRAAAERSRRSKFAITGRGVALLDGDAEDDVKGKASADAKGEPKSQKADPKTNARRRPRSAREVEDTRRRISPPTVRLQAVAPEVASTKSARRDDDQSEAETHRMKIAKAVRERIADEDAAGEKTRDEYVLPPTGLLLKEEARAEVDRGALAERGTRIVSTLAEFNIETRLVDVARGPAVTMYEFELAPGINVNRVTQLSNNVAMAVAAQDVRIIAPIPGRGTIGIEVPNLRPEIVRMRPVVEHYRSQPDRLALPLMLGRDATGTPLVADLSRMPHLLVAGATGSGKSVCMDGIIMSMAMLRRPDEVKFLLVDPKVVELSRYRGIPHLASPVVTEMKRAASVLGWAVQKMDERYAMFGATGVRDIASFNGMPAAERLELAGKKGAETPEAFGRNMPYIVIVVDELADLMMVAAKEVETSIIRLAQKSRSTGIHVVLATQRPSVDVLTGLIRANMPTRISFQVASRLESRIILDQNGAEKLLGKGDMLYMPAGVSSPVRAKGVYVTDEEITSVLEHVRAQPPVRNALMVDAPADAAAEGDDGDDVPRPVGSDELYEEAVKVILGTQRGSVSLLQRRLQVGYTRAGKLIDMMFADGLVGPQRGSKPREILVTLDEWEAKRGDMALKKSA